MLKAKANKTLYLWDLAGTIFLERWNKEKTGFDNVIKWVETYLGKKRSQMTDLEFEWAHKIPYASGWMFNLKLQPGFKGVLSWTKYNETFSIGNREQVKWRAKYLNPKVGFNILDYFQALNSTFDYGSKNKKTVAMLVKYLAKRYQQGYETVVYTDDKLGNLKFFRQAADKIKARHKDFNFRIYHILNNKNDIKKKRGYWEVGNLLDLLENEKKYYNNKE